MLTQFFKDLPNGWSIRKFNDLLAEPVRNGVYKPKEFHGRGQKMINMGELFAFNFISGQEMKRVELNAQELAKSRVQDGDLLFARRSLVLEGSGKCSLVVQPTEDTTFESSIIRARLNQSIADPKFYFYMFHSPLGRALMASIATRTAVSGITGSNLIQLDVPCPPLPTQRRIASILSAYDDLIENNTRRIKLLEQMAQAIYREWFVEFRAPGVKLRKATPEEQKVTGKDRFPVGWELKQLGDVAQDVRRSVQPDQIDPETPYFGLEHLPRKSIALSDWGTASEVQSTKLAFKKGEILFGKIRPYFHKVGVAPLDGVCSSDTIVIVPKSPEYFALVLACVSSEEFVNYSTQTSQGTKMPRANWDVQIKYPVVIPPQALLTQFNELVSDIVVLINNMVFRNRNLRQTRDLLLPRLVGGEVDVEKIAINVEELNA